jgi:hypothetical protein
MAPENAAGLTAAVGGGKAPDFDQLERQIEFRNNTPNNPPQHPPGERAADGNGAGGIGHHKVAYLLAELRCASLRARLIQADLDAIGLALRGGLISPDEAVALLADVDLLRLVGMPHDQVGAAAA